MHRAEPTNFQRVLVSFLDDNFIGHGKTGEKRALDLANAIMDRGLNIEYLIQARATETKESILRPLIDSGLRRVFIGVESMSQPILDYLNKGSKVEDNLKAIETLEKLGLCYEIGFILFTPQETRTDLIENLKFLRKMPNLKPYFLNRLRIYEGTPLAGSMQNGGMVEDDGRSLSYRFSDKHVDTAYGIVDSIQRYLMSAHVKIISLSVMTYNPFYQKTLGRDVCRKIEDGTDELSKSFSKLLLKIIDTLIEGLEDGSFVYPGDEIDRVKSALLSEISSIDKKADEIKSLLSANELCPS
ncbi:MAG: radical SAM protein [Rubrobacteridae bacterium]|nr:radical SAM protein [Rubrobacteridae bacterium]